ncbi:class II glutamine amidotransferase [Myxococcota bacterium]|nr:class II glutamine amidotransferase [Myxococcota bacterium]
MGRMAAYLGPSTRISSIHARGPLALFAQEGGAVQGFGLGWYPGDGSPEPLVLRSRLAPAREGDLLAITERYTSTAMLASIRKLGPSEPDQVEACAPFKHGPFLFHHDGELARYHEVFERPLRARLGAEAHRLVNTASASELLFATWVDGLQGQHTPEAAASALERMVELVRELAEPTETHATLGIVVTDGTSLVTLRTATAGTPPSMYTIVADEGAPVPATGRVIATEPIFPGSWSSIDPHSLIIFTAD